jgi:8-oxo-dGTP pyrophosphatase MutT (NUDIX family)
VTNRWAGNRQPVVPRGPWEQRDSRVVCTTSHFRVHRDDVVRPDGKPGHYDWIAMPDQVRVAAIVGGNLLLTNQHHYLIGSTLQLPGGGVEKGENSQEAAQRELRQETGFHGGAWTRHGFVCPLPSLTPSVVHLWSVCDPTPGDAEPESAERDLQILRVQLPMAVQAVLDGEVGCAASAALILLIAQTSTG